MRRFATCLVVLLSIAAFGEEPASQPRRKIGLVLEGGGALGLAHIGVLQWMEEHHIPVDYIAGTSMGGLIGGAYATGMRPAQVRTLVTQIDWDGVMRGEIAFSDFSFRRKQDRRTYPNGLEFGLRKGIRFPAGFNSGQKVNLILDRIALPYSELKSFDDLPIPFRCVATDLVSRSEYVFKDGSFSRALRATMSIPGFFDPVAVEGKIYVDGGLLDNLPTDVAKDMGAEFIIGIHLNSAPLPTDSVLSSFSIMAQSFNAVIASNERRGMQLADILVNVDVATFANTDYDNGAKIIQRGYEAAEKNAAALSKFALDEDEWRQHLAQREAKRLNSVPVPTFVQVQGTTEELAKSITRQLDGVKDKAIDEDELERKLTLLNGTGRFSGLGYQVTPVDGNYGLQINASEKQYGPPTINPIIVIDGSQYNNVRFTAGGRLTLMDIGKAGSELRTDVLAGSTYRLASEYFRPWGSSIHWFMLPHAGAESSSVDIYSRNTRLAEYRESQLDAGMDVGYMFDRFSQLSFGYDAGYLKYSPNIGDRQTLPSVSGRQGIIGAHYVTDHLDQPVVPEKGIAAVSDFGFYEARPSAADRFPALKSSIQFFKPLPKGGSLYFAASGGTTFGFSHTGVPPFSLGGPLRLSAYGTNEIFTNQYMLYQLGYLHPIAQLPPIIGKKVYFISVYEIAKPYGTFGKLATSKLPMDIAGGVIFETLFGPVQVGGSWGDSGHRKVYFALGRVF